MAKKPTQIKTYYGVPVPPWRHDPVIKSATFVFLLTGSIPSKKNELVAAVERRDAFRMIDDMVKAGTKMFTPDQTKKILYETYGRVKNAKPYEEWEEKAVATFEAQRNKQFQRAAKHNLIFPLSKATVSIKFYWKGKYRRDNSNKSEGIHDALVKALVLQDDSYLCIPDTAVKAKDYSEEITDNIAMIYITAPIA